MEQSNFDVLTFHSNSYFSDLKAFQSHVGDGEGPLPFLDGSQPSILLRRRVRGKHKPLQQDVRSQCALVPTDSPECSGPVCASQDIGLQPSPKRPKWYKGILQRDEPQTSVPVFGAQDIGSQPSPKRLKSLQRHDAQTQTEENVNESVDRLRAFVHSYAASYGTMGFLHDLPPKLQSFLHYKSCATSIDG